MEESRLIERLQERDERAFSVLVRMQGDAIYRLAFRMLGSKEEAEDAAQEVFVRVFKSIEQFRGDCPLSSWTYRICLNICRNRFQHQSRRKQKSHVSWEGALMDEQGTSNADGNILRPARPDELMQAKQMEERLQKALTMLDADFRSVLVFFDLEGLNYLQISEVLSIPEGTVKSRLFRARQQLRAALKELAEI